MSAAPGAMLRGLFLFLVANNGPENLFSVAVFSNFVLPVHACFKQGYVVG